MKLDNDLKRITNYHCMDNIQSVHKGLHLYLVILFLLFVSRILAFNFMLMYVKIRRYRAIIIIIIIVSERKFIFRSRIVIVLF